MGNSPPACRVTFCGARRRFSITTRASRDGAGSRFLFRVGRFNRPFYLSSSQPKIVFEHPTSRRDFFIVEHVLSSNGSITDSV